MTQDRKTPQEIRDSYSFKLLSEQLGEEKAYNIVYALTLIASIAVSRQMQDVFQDFEEYARTIIVARKNGASGPH